VTIAERAPVAAVALAVRLLGRVSVVRDGAALSAFGSGPLLRLVTSLVLRPGVLVSRTELAFRLWPDSSEAQARTNLRKALHQLRHELDDADRFVEVLHGSVRWLADAPAQVDVVAFLASCDDGDDRGAADAYGGVLLPGVYDDWVLEERARLHGLVCAALARLTQDADGGRAAAIGYASRLVELEPTSEWAHRQVIEAHLERGDRASAIRAYHRCVELLANELGVEPAAETKALYERFAGAEARVVDPLPRRATPLVGRDDAWAALGHRWQRVGLDTSHLVVVSGEGGAGKTRLLAEFARHVRAEGVLALIARSHETVDAAWAPVAAWLGDEGLLPLLAEAPVALLSEVSRLAPALRARGDVTPPVPVADELARYQFTESVVAALLYGDAARLLVLDDVQWCDAPTLGLVAHLLHSRPSAPVFVVALVRPEDLDDGHPFVRLRDVLATEGRVTVVELGRLSRDETERVAEAVAPIALDVSDHDRIWAESNGNPLFVVELAKSAKSWSVERGQLAPTVRAVLDARLRRLSVEARRVAEAAAVIGGDFSFDELASVLRTDADQLAGALDELWRRQIVSECGNRYDFTHDKLRDVVAAALSGPRRRQLHADIADGLVTVHGATGMGARVAYHLRAAGRFREAIDAARRSAQMSLRLFDLDEAVGALRDALALVAEFTSRAEAVTVEREVLIDLGAVLVAREGYGSPDARDVYARAMALARLDGELIDPAILRGLGLSAVVSCRFEEAERFGRMLTTSVDDPVARTEGHYLRGVTAFWLGDMTRSAAELETALHAYVPEQRDIHQTRFAQDPYPVCLVRLALTRFWQGHESDAVELADQALEWCERTGHKHSTSYVLAYLGMLAAERRDIERLAAVTGSGRELWTAAQGFFAAFGPLYEGWRGVLAGEPNAVTSIDDALAEWRRTGQVLHLTHGLVLRTRAALLANDHTAARHALNEALHRTEATGQRYLLDEIHRLGAVVPEASEPATHG
jgi:DNA-binding SARP family transcriptional activator